MILFFDSDCGLCARAAAFLGRLDLGVEIAPGWNEELLVHGVDFGRFARAIPLVLEGGQVCYGAVAIALALKTSGRRWVRCAGALMLAPGLRPVAEKVYRAVADNRWRLPGSTCTVSPGHGGK